MKSTYVWLQLGLRYKAKTMSCAVMQECSQLGAEHVASKHYAKSVHRLEAMLQVFAQTVCSISLHSTDAAC